MTTPVLRSAHLLLDAYVPADEQPFVALFQDPRVSRWIGDGPSPEADDRALFGRILSKVYPQHLFDVWAVRRHGELVGHAELKPTDTVDGYELVYALRPDQWGLGLGTELAGLIVAHGFTTVGLPAIYATVYEDNRASLVVLDRLGFGHVRNMANDDGPDTVVLVRQAPDHTALRSLHAQ